MAIDTGAKVKAILANRGWLAFDSFYFDNGWELDIRATSGLIAMDTLNDLFITVLADSHSEIHRNRGIVAIDKDMQNYVLNDYAQIAMSDVNQLQRFAFCSYMMKAKLTDPTVDISNLTIPNIKTFLDDATPDIVQVKYSSGAETEIVEHIDMHSDAYLVKPFTDTFEAKQTQFKQYIVKNFGTELGITIANLI